MSQLPQEASITSLSSVRHYGVSANSYYKESEDLGQEKIWDRWEMRWRVSKMTWYISKVCYLKLAHCVLSNSASTTGRRSEERPPSGVFLQSKASG